MYQKFHKLRVRFAEMEISQGRVAKAAGLSPGAMSSRMTGKYPWTATEMKRISAVLDIPPEKMIDYFFEDVPQNKKGA